jgi:hypothetical protein
MKYVNRRLLISGTALLIAVAGCRQGVEEAPVSIIPSPLNWNMTGKPLKLIGEWKW